MAKLLNGQRVKLILPTGDAYLILREPTCEELNNYHAKKFDVPDKATEAETLLHTKRAQGALFDLLLTGVEELEDEKGPITPERADAIPLDYKAEIVYRRFDRVPIAFDEKN